MPESDNKIQVAVIFGGRSAEHEISVATGMEALAALDTRKYQGIPVYIAEDGRWFSGQPLTNKSFYQGLPGSLNKALEDKDADNAVREVVLVPSPSRPGGDQRNSLQIIGEETGGLSGVFKKQKAKSIAVDVYLPALHGAFGEDGCIQGLLEIANCPYVGAGVLPASVGMDKSLCKTVLAAADIPVLAGGTIERDKWRKDPEAAKEAFKQRTGLDQFPLFVKPCRQGSSIGIAPAKDEDELDVALATAFKYDTEALIEPQVTEIAEVNVSVLSTSDGIRTSVVEEPISSTGVLTFEDKYGKKDGAKKSGGDSSMALANRILDPDHYSDAFKARAKSLAQKAYETLGLSGVARVDFLVDKAKVTDGEPALFFNEINTLPGSLSFYLWEKSQPPITYPQLLGELITEAMSRQDYRSDYASNLYIRPLFSSR